MTRISGIDLALARKVLQTEAEAVLALVDRLDERFEDAIRILLDCRGRVIVTGMGKSGIICRKIAATLTSTGTPAFFLHPAEAIHGDLGVLRPDDVVIALSNSGETEELLRLLETIKRLGARMIALTGSDTSTLAQAADVALDCRVSEEACPINLVPTASTTAALALGDALALALLDARGFSSEDFARAHPGGALGRRLLTRVADVMRTGDALPVVDTDATLAEAIVEMSGKGMGMTCVVGHDGVVAGIFTDGDLRRCLDRITDIRGDAVVDVMTRTPRTIAPDRLAIDCVDTMEAAPKVTQLLVVDERGVLVGALHLHDLFRARVV